VHITLNRNMIISHGLPAVGAFLKKLQICKSTCDVPRATALFARYTQVPEAWLPLRSLVIQKRKPRQSFVQPMLELAERANSHPLQLGSIVTSPLQSTVVMRTFPGTLGGAVDAFVSRFPEVDHAVLDLWRRELPSHQYLKT